MLHKTVLCVCLLLLQRLYRETYHKQKDKIHTTYDTPDIKQVKMNQEHLSDVRTPSDYNIHVLFFKNSCCKTNVFLFPSYPSCATKRNTTTAEAS